MATNIPDAVRRVFSETFAARDIAEPLASFDAGASCDEVRAFMRSNDFDVVGIRDEGRIVGYVEQESLTGGLCGDFRRNFDVAVVLNESTPLLTVLLKLNEVRFGFVTVLGQVGGIITHDDFQKAPVRMWLFGLVTMIELRFTELIVQHLPADDWKQYVSAARLQKAEALLDERRRRNQALRLFDCLQFSDKGQIIARNETIRNLTVLESRRSAEDVVKKIERLRNNLAHAQDILASDWDTIVELCKFVIGK